MGVNCQELGSTIEPATGTVTASLYNARALQNDRRSMCVCVCVLTKLWETDLFKLD